MLEIQLSAACNSTLPLARTGSPSWHNWLTRARLTFNLQASSALLRTSAPW